MTEIRILLQTTIPAVVDDWHIGRFSLLRDHLAGLEDEQGLALCRVTARDRDPTGRPDSVLSTLDRQPYDQLWLFAVDTGDGLTPEDRAGITRFRRRGGGLLLARDHMDLGCSVCELEQVGAAHHFHSHNLDPDESRRSLDDRATTSISWPNYHSGRNGDYQAITISAPRHPLVMDPADSEGQLRYLPSHPHEGAVSAPPGDSSARVIATGTSQATRRPFNLAVAFDASPMGARAVAQSTFHHFVDLNWDPTRGAPSFVTEASGDALSKSPQAQASVRRYATNVALWLADQATN